MFGLVTPAPPRAQTGGGRSGAMTRRGSRSKPTGRGSRLKGARAATVRANFYRAPSPASDPPLPPAPLLSPINLGLLAGSAALGIAFPEAVAVARKISQQVWGLFNPINAAPANLGPETTYNLTGQNGTLGAIVYITLTYVQQVEHLNNCAPVVNTNNYAQSSLNIPAGGTFKIYTELNGAGYVRCGVQGRTFHYETFDASGTQSQELVIGFGGPNNGVSAIDAAISLTPLGDPLPAETAFPDGSGAFERQDRAPIKVQEITAAAVPEPAAPLPLILPLLPGSDPSPAPGPDVGTGTAPAPAPVRRPVPIAAAPVTSTGTKGRKIANAPSNAQQTALDGSMLPVGAPLPVRTPSDDVFYGDRPFGGNSSAPRPNLNRISNELGRIEKKLGAMLSPQPQQSPEFWQNLKDGWDVLNQIADFFTEQATGTTYTLTEPCPVQGVEPVQVEWEVQGSPRVNRGVLERLDAIAEMLQYSKDWRQPICKHNAIGQPVTVQFIESNEE